MDVTLKEFITLNPQTSKEKVPMSKVKVIREHSSTGGGAVYGFGFIGALVYYFQHADSFAQFVMGFLKAIVWPAMVVYKVIEYFKL